MTSVSSLVVVIAKTSISMSAWHTPRCLTKKQELSSFVMTSCIYDQASIRTSDTLATRWSLSFLHAASYVAIVRVENACSMSRDFWYGGTLNNVHGWLFPTYYSLLERMFRNSQFINRNIQYSLGVGETLWRWIFVLTSQPLQSFSLAPRTLCVVKNHMVEQYPRTFHGCS